MAFIVNLRTAQNATAGAAGIVANASLQVTDLWPYKSQRGIYSPQGLGPFYCNQAANNAVTVAGGATTAVVEGLTAYLIANLDSAATTVNFTAAEAATVAGLIFTDVYTGAARPGDTAIGSARINVHANATVAGAGLNTNAGPDGNAAPTLAQHVVNILQILSGARFTLPAGTANNTAVPGTGTYNSQVMNQAQFLAAARIADTDSSLNNSMLNGQLSFLGNDALQLFKATAAARVVQVYTDAGAPLL